MYAIRSYYVLGQRTGELHRAFSRRTGDAAFDPEPITSEDLAAWSRQLHEESVATLDELEKRHESLSADLRTATDRLLSLRKELLEKISLPVITSYSIHYTKLYDDHPYVREHPDWFRHRPDGSIQYAENPPKKYQDIYPFDFES